MDHDRRSPSRHAATTEWPSLLLAAAIHAGWMATSYCAARAPWWAVLPASAWFMAWHMSLQHEVIHGHPTRSARLNDLIGSLPVSLWLPYGRYKATHLSHHEGGNLTDPVDDPESHYVSRERFERAGPVLRAALEANTTLLGRVLIGPLLGVSGFLRRELDLVLAGDRAAIGSWLRHLAGMSLVLAWLLLVCHLSLVRYVALFVYPGFALALVRSFAEHRAADEAEHRTAIVEHAPVLGLLFLNNNLHVVHHLRPGLAWYRIPAAYAAERSALLAHNGGLVYRGYADIARRYLLRQHDRPVHERV